MPKTCGGNSVVKDFRKLLSQLIGGISSISDFFIWNPYALTSNSKHFSNQEVVLSSKVDNNVLTKSNQHSSNWCQALVYDHQVFSSFISVISLLFLESGGPVLILRAGALLNCVSRMPVTIEKFQFWSRFWKIGGSNMSARPRLSWNTTLPHLEKCSPR